VAQNAVKHGLFAYENVINCEKQSDFDRFREELVAGLAPAGGVEAMLAERIVSLSWRLKRVERMNSEVIDVMMARVETSGWYRTQRREAGESQDPRAGGVELLLGWATMRDFSESQVLERLLMYEKRIESSLYKAMNELQKLQRMREKAEAEEAIPKASGFEDTTPRGRDAHETQGRDALATEAATRSGEEKAEFEKQSQLPARGRKSETSGLPHVQSQKTNPILLLGGLRDLGG
jgi:hypothetical protein